MTQFEQEQAAKKFVEIWKDKGNERSEAQKFWIQLLREVYGVQNSEQYIDFELPVKIKNTSFADGFIADTKVLIEMKGKDIDLTKEEKQSDGTMLTPFQQAKRYADELVYDKGVRWIIVSNFKEIHIYDMKKRHQKPEIILLKELPKFYYVLQILVNNKDENIKKEEQISKKAGDIIGKIYDVVKPLYENPNDDETLKNLNKFCVRLVFCLYAEDAGLFGNRLMFHDYLKKYKAEDMREALIALFDTLNTEIKKRNPYLKEDLKEFPYVNGGLFEDNIEIPRLNEKFKTLLLEKASENFDWTEISPTIFGAVFESTLNQETRSEGGMHYTSVENIRKVIKPLFLNDLQYEFEKIKNETVIKTKKELLYNFQEKLAKFKFLDPACGSGNFLTQTYLEIRNIENEIIKELIRIDKKQIANQVQIGDSIVNPIKVSINQFYGIEINDFAVSVARTALWIAEHQMFEKTRSITYMKDEFLPLRSYTNIIEANALRIDWNEVLSNNECNYIIGNPPFVGSSKTDKKSEQKIDMKILFKDIKGAGKLDYVAGWYLKAALYIANTNIKCAFVSTNSITQGEQVSLLWKNLFEKHNIEIIYAYKSFKWKNDSNDEAAVVCVIIGFREKNNSHIDKFIFDKDKKIKVDFINGYLENKNNLFIKSRTNELNDENPKIIQGNKPWDGGYLILSQNEKDELERKYPKAKNFVKRFLGGNELIKNKYRYCLWLKDVKTTDYADIPEIVERLKMVAKVRTETKTEAVQLQAKTPMLFSQIRQPECNYLAIPEVSSDSRKYIPMAFLTKDDISSNKLLMIPNASIYLFAILESNVHMAWMRVVSGRLGTGYSYSPSVYNNFPFPHPNLEQKKKIENCGRKILEARSKYKDVSLEEMYGEKLELIYTELYNAHNENNMAVMEAYGFDYKKMSEDDCVAELMKMYQELISK